MIDWRSLFFTVVWVLGLAILLAGWSYRRWSKQPNPAWLNWLGTGLLLAGLLALRFVP